MFWKSRDQNCPKTWIMDFGRHERTRTADPFRVREVLYQLSYVPKGVKLAKGLITLRERESNKRLIEKSSNWS